MSETFKKPLHGMYAINFQDSKCELLMSVTLRELPKDKKMYNMEKLSIRV